MRLLRDLGADAPLQACVSSATAFQIHTVPCAESATKADDAETAARVAIEQLAAAKKSGLTREVWQMAYDEVYLLMQKSNGAADAGTGAAWPRLGQGGAPRPSS